MSVKVSNWAWHDARNADGSKVTGNQLILLLALADVADDSGFCRYVSEDAGLTYDGLAAKTGVDRRTIERLIPKLRAQELIDHRRGVKGRPNEFEVLVPWHRSTDKVSGNVAADSPTAVQDSPTNDAGFPDNAGSHSSIDVFNVTTRISSSDAVASDPTEYSDDVIRLCRLLGLLVSQNGHKVGEIGKLWWAACERLIRIDGYSVEQIEIIIRWATADEFWAANIRSMPKLREKFSTLRLQRNAKLAKVKPGKLARASSVIEMGRAMDAQAAAEERQAVNA